MKCSDVEILLPDFVVNKLSNGQYSGVHSHLESCADCRITANKFSELLVGLQNVKSKEPSDLYFASILPRVHEKLESKKQSFQIPEYLLRFILPVAMMLMLVMFAVNYQPPATTITPNTTETEIQDDGSETWNNLLGLDVDATAENITQEDRSIITEILSEVSENISMNEEVTESLLSSMNEDDASQLLAMLEEPTDDEQR